MITKLLIETWGKEAYLKLPIHYKIYLRNNYKRTLNRRAKNENKN